MEDYYNSIDTSNKQMILKNQTKKRSLSFKKKNITKKSYFVADDDFDVIFLTIDTFLSHDYYFFIDSENKLKNILYCINNYQYDNYFTYLEKIYDLVDLGTYDFFLLACLKEASTFYKKTYNLSNLPLLCNIHVVYCSTNVKNKILHFLDIKVKEPKYQEIYIENNLSNDILLFQNYIKSTNNIDQLFNSRIELQKSFNNTNNPDVYAKLNIIKNEYPTLLIDYIEYYFSSYELDESTLPAFYTHEEYRDEKYCQKSTRLNALKNIANELAYPAIYRHFNELELRIVLRYIKIYNKNETINKEDIDIDDLLNDPYLVKPANMKTTKTSPIFNDVIDNYLNLFSNKFKNSNENSGNLADFGKKGEEEVDYCLKWLDKNYIVVTNNDNKTNHIELMNKDFIDESQEFDHIVIGKQGIFLIETKNYKGKIIIDKNGNWIRDKEGTLVGERNPLQQIRRHEKLIKSIVGENINIINIICLAHPNIIIEGQENSSIPLIKSDLLVEYIENYSTNEYLNKDEMQLCLNKIKSHML